MNQPLWLQPINATLNRALLHAGLTPEDFSGLEHATALVKIRSLPDFLLQISAQQWTLSLPSEAYDSWPLPDTIDLLIETDIASLKTMIDTGHVPPGKLKMSGDMAIAQQLQSLLKKADIDWIGLLATITGDIPAQLLGNSAQTLLQRSQRIGRDKAASMVEYLLHEKQLLVTQAEWQTLRTSSQQLADQVERALARCQSLSNDLQARRNQHDR